MSKNNMPPQGRLPGTLLHMKILYIGGTGQISFDCVHESVRQGHETWVFNRGNSNAGLPDATRYITGDFNNDADYRKIVEEGFDAICQFRLFTAEQMQRDLDLFAGQVDQYVFISSASAYEKPVRVWPITEQVPLVNPYWEYSRDKIECEDLLTAQSKLPYTIVRPSHTSRDRLITPTGEGDLMALRLLAGRPVVLPGDGTSLWTVTAARDFAPPFVKLLGNDAALGEAFHLTSDRAFAWNAICEAMAEALGVAADIVHVPTQTLVKYKPEWQGPLWGDKAHSAVFDNSKIKSVVGDFSIDRDLASFTAPLVEAFKQRQAAGITVDAELDALFDRIVADQRAVGA